MWAYVFRRLLLIIPTLIGIITLNFFIVQVAPGGPVEQMIAQIQGIDASGTERVAGGGNDFSSSQGTASSTESKYRGAQGLDPALIADIEKLYGFDKPLLERYLSMLKDYALFNFGDSFYQDKSVIDLIIEKMPVTISLGLWSTLLIYFISIPLGIKKAVKHGSPFDIYTSSLIIVGYAIPNFLFAILLIVLFAGGSYFNVFPLRGLSSTHAEQMSTLGQIADYFWHLALPIAATVISGFATLTLLTKNSFLDEINKQYVITARAKGLQENRILYHHVFRNAMLLIISGLPAALIAIFFTSNFLIEIIFSLDGLGLLGFEAIMKRDYPVMFGTLYIFTLIGLLLKLISDITYMMIDPRIDFESRG